MLDSQSGPHAASVFPTRPVSPELSLRSSFLRVLLLRRLRLPVPLTAARCRCRQPHDLFGDHLAACPRSGVLGGPASLLPSHLPGGRNHRYSQCPASRPQR